MQYKVLFHSVGILLLAVLMLTNSPFAWILYGLFILRVLSLKEWKFFCQLLIFHALVSGYFLFQGANRHSVLSGTETELTMEIAITEIKVEGDLLAFQGQTSVDGQTEKVQVFYNLKEEADQAYWLAMDQSFQAVVSGDLEQADNNQNFHLFNYRTYLERQDIYWIMSPDVIEIKATLNHEKYWLANQRQAIINWLGKLAHPTIAAYTLSLFFNEMDALDGEVLAAYQAIGLIHYFQYRASMCNTF